MKLNLEKFKGIYGQIGEGFQTHSDMLNTDINAEGDLQLFIEQNRSGNEKLKKEVFQPFDDAGAISKVMNRKFNHAERIDDMSQIAVSKKQQKTKYKSRREASPELQVINDNYIQIGPNSMIEAGTKQKRGNQDNIFEILDSEENALNDGKVLQEKMRKMIHESQVIEIEEKG